MNILSRIGSLVQRLIDFKWKNKINLPYDRNQKVIKEYYEGKKKAKKWQGTGNVLLVLFLITCLVACGKTPFESLENMPKSTKTVDPETGVETFHYAPGELPQIIELGMIEECRNRKSERERQQEEADRAEQAAILESAANSKNPGVIIAYFTSRTTEKVVASIMDMNKNVWGKAEKDECSSGTNMWDFMSVEATERQKTYRVAWKEGGSMLTGVVKWGVGGWVLTTFSRNSGDTTVGGDYNNAGRNVQSRATESQFEGTEDRGSIQSVQTGVTDSNINPNLDKSDNTAEPPEPVIVEPPKTVIVRPEVVRVPETTTGAE